MVVSITILLIVLTYASSTSAAYSGKGEIYFSHQYEYSESGLRVVYRPENYEKYSAIGEGWTAKFGAQGRTSKYYAERGYDEDVLDNRKSWVTLSWDSKGKYYYYEQYSWDLKGGNWIGYGVDIYNRDNDLIYEDINNLHQLPSTVGFCELDEDAYKSSKKCSEVFEYSSSNNEFENSRSNNEFENSRSNNAAGAIAAGVIVPLVAIAIIIGVIICVKRGHCERVKAALPAPNISFPTRNQPGQAAPVPPAQTQQATPHAMNAPSAYQPPSVQQPFPANAPPGSVSQQAPPNISYSNGVQQQVTFIQSTGPAPMHTAQATAVPPAFGAANTTGYGVQHAAPVAVVPSAPTAATAPPAPSQPLARSSRNNINTAAAIVNILGEVANMSGDAGTADFSVGDGGADFAIDNGNLDFTGGEGY